VYRFHVNLFAEPKVSSFACTWEDAAARLERLPMMIFELDGSFIFSGNDAAGRRWQVDGHLFDFEDQLHRVELHGSCPTSAFEDLLRCIGWPAQPLAFEMVRSGKTVDEAGFRRAASAGDALHCD
jgi:hypothetical protein